MTSTGTIDSLSPGQRVGRYIVDSRLARGGMGEVWLATARGPGGFEKRVVVKTVLPSLAEKPGYVNMLVKEASLAARLNHPNVVQVFDLGCVGGLYYIAMEHLSGRSLAQMLRRAHEIGQKVPVPVLCAMAAAACDGLAYAHAHTDDDGKPLGLLHRDISPSNLMLTFAGRVALLDFGVATATRGRYATRSGQIKGKFHYLAPERVRGEPHDRRSDIYSLGVVLYQCLTLRWPFRARNDFELLSQIANQHPPPPRQHDPTIPEPLERIVMRAMARDPADRYPDAAVLAGDLRALARATGQIMTAPDLAGYLARLFPDAPELAAHQPTAGEEEEPPSIIEIDDDDEIEIVFQSADRGTRSDRRERSDRRDGDERDRHDRGRHDRGRLDRGRHDHERDRLEPTSDRSESSTALDAAGPSTWATGSAPSAPRVVERRTYGGGDVDIFPEPTRVSQISGPDVFGSARRARRRRTYSEPAFFGVRLPRAGGREDAG